MRNYAPDPVELAITVTPASAGGGDPSPTPTYEAAVSVDADEERTLSVFDPEGRYRVRAALGDRSVGFTTRPICSEASTAVTVNHTRRLTYVVTYCEGGPRMGSATPVRTDG